jgi:hypothetical protein
MSKIRLKLTKNGLSRLILHAGLIIATLLLAIAVGTAVTSLPVSLDTYKQFLMTRETAIAGIAVALEALAGSCFVGMIKEN